MNNSSFIVDAHLDLSMNALEWNRNLKLSVEEIRAAEFGMTDKVDRGNNTVSLPSMREGNVGLCFATLIARYAKPDHPLGGCNSPEQAWATTQGQLAWYREMEGQKEMFCIRNKIDLQSHLANWANDKAYSSIGYVLTLEGADSIVTFDHLYSMYEKGLRAIGPAHYGPGTYAFGTNSSGGIGSNGRELLSKMEELEMVLDATHLCDFSFWEAMDHFKGDVWASHSNCRSLVDHNRQFSDDQIKILIERGGVIGMPLDAWMMVPNWKRHVSTPKNTNVTLENMIDNMDHICQIAGNCDHIGIGSDLDGGFGSEQGPSDVNTISDLQKLNGLLKNRGYSDDDIQKILSENWINKLEEILK